MATMQLLLAMGYGMTSEETSNDCGVYLAPSTIPGAGLGIFAGDHPIAKGEAVGMGDILIPIVDFHWHNGGKNNTTYPFLWFQYTWMGDGFKYLEEGEVHSWKQISAASPGFGAATNSLQDLVNTEDDRAKMKISRAMKGRSPSIGAISPHHDRQFKATKNIAPGAEMFIE
jgi:hypothetical protein